MAEPSAARMPPRTPDSKPEQLPLRVLASPARSNREKNPYNQRLSDALERAGAVVEEFSLWRLATNGADIWHIHWPDHALHRPTTPRAALTLLRLLLTVSLAKCTRTTIVWTVHNTASHDVDHPWLDRLLWATFPRGIDGWLALSSAAKREAIATFPVLAQRPCWVIPHGDYRGAYAPPPERARARERLGLAVDHRVLLFFGLVRPYKNVPHLIELVRTSPDPDLRLVVAGAAESADEQRLRALAAEDPRIRLDLGFVASEQVPALFAAADLAVLPFRRVLNSGSVLLSLSLDTPVLVPAVGSLVELAEDPGPAWVTTYEGELDLEDLHRGIEMAAHVLGDRAPLASYDWDAIGERTLAAYRRLRREPFPVPRAPSGAG